MMLPQIQLLFSLGDAAQIHGVRVGGQARLGLLQELDGSIDVFVLSRGQDSQRRILDRVEFVREGLDERLVQSQQVRVLCGVKSFLLEVAKELVTNLVPQPDKQEQLC